MKFTQSILLFRHSILLYPLQYYCYDKMQKTTKNYKCYLVDKSTSFKHTTIRVRSWSVCRSRLRFGSVAVDGGTGSDRAHMKTTGHIRFLRKYGFSKSALTFGRQRLNVSQIERSLSRDDLVDDYGEGVNVPFLRALRRRMTYAQQFRSRPQERCKK